jgi:hypothetical protein
MAIVKTIPSQRLINGEILNSSEVALISENDYTTMGEECVIIRKVDYCRLTLNSKTTDHIVIKALTKVLIKPLIGLIDEEYEEVEIDKGASVEFRWANGNWYILSSDGLKQS